MGGCYSLSLVIAYSVTAAFGVAASAHDDTTTRDNYVESNGPRGTQGIFVKSPFEGISTVDRCRDVACPAFGRIGGSEDRLNHKPLILARGL